MLSITNPLDFQYYYQMNFRLRMRESFSLVDVTNVSYELWQSNGHTCRRQSNGQ